MNLHINVHELQELLDIFETAEELVGLTPAQQELKQRVEQLPEQL